MLRYIFSAKYRLSTYILTILYLILYDYVYSVYMFPVWGYMGVEYNSLSVDNYIVFLLIGAFPVLFYSGLKNIASGLSIMIYLFGILPCYHAVCTCNPLPIGTFYGYAIAFIVCGTMFFMTDSLYLLKRPFIRPHKRYISIRIVEITTILMVVILIATYHSQMTFVNFFTDPNLLYDKREENSSLSVLGFILYFRQWLSNGLFPFLLLVYLRENKRLKVALILVGYFIVFLIEMSKSTFLMPIVILSLYTIINRRQYAVRDYYYSGFLLAISSILLLLLNSFRGNAIFTSFAAIFIMRTICVEGWLCNLYIPFFEVHPYTYFTHINIIDFITQAYPYADSIGRTVTGGEQNANAFFLLMDGVAGMGISGVYIVSAVFIIIKGILNSISLKYDKSLCILIFFPATIAIINVSIFTAILTCGLLILYLLFTYVNAPMLQTDNKNLMHQ